MHRISVSSSIVSSQVTFRIIIKVVNFKLDFQLSSLEFKLGLANKIISN